MQMFLNLTQIIIKAVLFDPEGSSVLLPSFKNKLTVLGKAQAMVLVKHILNDLSYLLIENFGYHVSYTEQCGQTSCWNYYKL